MTKRHGHTTKYTQSPTYVTYQNMLGRCLRKTHSKWPQYGAVGITVCDRWAESFENFLEDMGERPTGTTIDRIDGRLGYFKENCRWATAKQQQSNISTNVIITFNGVTDTLSGWSRELGCDPSVIRHRLKSGWSVEDALTIAPKFGNRKKTTNQRLYTYEGRTQCLSHWAKEFDLSVSLLRLRLSKGMTLAEALTKPKGVFVTKAQDSAP